MRDYEWRNAYEAHNTLQECDDLKNEVKRLRKMFTVFKKLSNPIFHIIDFCERFGIVNLNFKLIISQPES